MDALERVARYCLRHSLLPKGSLICCAVSGGPDSVALLHVMLALRERFGVRVAACHVEHGIRGEASAGDMEFVKALCADWATPLTVHRVNVPQLAKDLGHGLETAAREARRVFFGDLMQDGADHIALGHHADDQAETALMQLSRGARGALGMRPHAQGVIRPLLCLSRADIMAYLSGQNLAYRTDTTNETPDNPRNLIRLRVMPELRKAYPAAAWALSRATEYMREDDDFLESLAADWLAGDRDKLPDNAILRRAVALQAHGAGQDERLTHALIQRVLTLYREGGTGERVEANGMIWERAKDGRISLIVSREGQLDGEIELNVPGETRIDGHLFITEILDEWRNPLPDGKTSQVFDANALPRLSVRTRRPGDQMRPLGMRGRRKLKEILIDRGIPQAVRDVTPLLADGQRVYWMPGLPPDDEAKITPDTIRYLWIRYVNQGGVSHE